MSGSGEAPVGKDAARSERDRRLADALRRNLRRRKAAAGAGNAVAEELARTRPDVVAGGRGMRAEEAIAELLRATKTAHHNAHSPDEAAHDEWALWYAGYLQSRLGELLGRAFTVSEIVYLLVRAERERQAEQPAPDWPPYYASVILRECSV